MPDGVEATAEDGNLTLTGTVEYGTERAAAELAVAGLAGVRNVRDEIDISYDDDSADVDLHVQEALARSALVPDDSDVKVATDGSIITLTGHVRTWAEHDAVDDVRVREAARSRELAVQGHLLRLWRPPLRPGEWRTLGLFAAADDGQLEKVLASMPLRVWRTDEVTALGPHPNDPGLAAGTTGSEFLTTFVIAVPEGTPSRAVEEIEAREAERAQELAGQGRLRRLWTLPGQGCALGLWQAGDPAEMQANLRSLPLDAWMTVQTTPLSRHPSDPAGQP